MASSLPWEFYDSLDSARVDLDHAHGTGRSGLWIGQAKQRSGYDLAAVFLGLRRLFRPIGLASLRIADRLGEHLAQLCLRLRGRPRDRCLPVSHVHYVGMSGRELNPAGDRKNRA